MWLSLFRHNVQSVIKKGLPLESGLLSITETDETEDFNQSELDQVMGAPTQVLSQLLL